MNLYISHIVDQLDHNLKNIDEKYPDFQHKVEQSIQSIGTALKQLKEYVCKNSFSSQIDEITFFKEIKPSIYSKLIYFIEIFNIHLNRPVGSISKQKKYLSMELKKIDCFFSENIEFYRYYRNKMTYLDDKYFVRGNLDFRLAVDDYIYNADPLFATSHDYKVAKILANELLKEYLDAELNSLKHKTGHGTLPYKKTNYSWTESKIALVELIYALQTCGCINNGTGDIKEIAVLFESIFNIDLGDFYRTYLEIKLRQNPTKFLDNMRASLKKKIVEQTD